MAYNSDDEQCCEDVDAGHSLTYPVEAGAIKKGGYIMIKDHPCKVVSLSTHQTGKHGHGMAALRRLAAAAGCLH